MASAAGEDSRRSRASAAASGVVIVGMCVTLWWPAFTLGAWGTLFFDQQLTVWAASVGGLVVVLTQSRGRSRVWSALALLVPSLWLLLSFLPFDDEHPASIAIELLAVVVALLGLPVTLWVLARVMWPEIGDGVGWRRRVLVLAIVAVIGLASYLLGVNHEHYLTCGDFTISGNSEPPGCVK